MAGDLAKAVKPVAATLVLRDKDGKKTMSYKVEVFLDREKELFSVRFTEGDYMKGMEAHLPASTVIDAVGKKNGR